MSRVLVLNGPEPRPPRRARAGGLRHGDVRRAGRRVRRRGAELGLEVDVRQTDDEAELVGWLHEAADTAAAVVLNPAAFTHYSYALRDACAQLARPWSRCTSRTRPPGSRSGTRQ